MSAEEKRHQKTGLGNTRNQAPKEVRNRFFTLNNWTEDEKDALDTWFQGRKNFSYMYQAEVGENGTPHLQGVWRSKSPIKMEFLKKSFPRIHWEPIKHGWAKCVEYCSKLDTRADGPWHSSDVKIPACNLDPKKGIIDPLDGANLYVWQCWVEHILKTRPDDRTVYWFWEARGNCGKSAMVKHIYLKYWDKVVIATGKGNDVRNQVNRHVNGDPNKGIDGKPLEIALLDFSRSIEDFVSYETIEQIKNGLLYSGKYEGGVCCFNTPHVICFANFEPDVSKLSADRWVIIEIDDNMMLLDDYEEIDHDVFSCEPPARSVSASSSLHQESDSIKDDPLSGLSPC